MLPPQQHPLPGSCRAPVESWPWLAATHLSSCFTPPAGQERKQEEKSKKLIRQNIDGEITYQVLLGAKQTQLREFIILGKKLTNLNIPFLQVSEGQLTAGPALLPCYHSKCQSVPSGREGEGSQKLLGAGVVPGTKWLLCAAPSFSLSLCFDIVPLWAAACLWECLCRHGSFPKSHYYVQQV